MIITIIIITTIIIMIKKKNNCVAGTLHAVKDGADELPNLDPFGKLKPLENNNFALSISIKYFRDLTMLM